MAKEQPNRSPIYSRTMYRLIIFLFGFAAIIGVQVTRRVSPEQHDIPVLSLSRSKTVYPFSVVAGGVESAAEVRAAMKDDPKVAAHYAAIKLAELRPVKQVGDVRRHVSYRMDGAIYWTSKPVTIKDGELLLTDGSTTLRGRCGNMLSEGPRAPTKASASEPLPRDLDNPIWLGYMPQLRSVDTPPVMIDDLVAGSVPDPASIASTGTPADGLPSVVRPLSAMPSMPPFDPARSASGAPYIPGTGMPPTMLLSSKKTSDVVATPENVVATPEPSAIVMTILGLAGIFWSRRMFASARSNV